MEAGSQLGPVWDDPRVRRGMVAQAALREARLRAGETLVGWKLGLGAPGARAKFGSTGPVLGFMTSAGATAASRAASFTGPTVEPELAVRVGTELTAGMSRAAVGRALAGVAVAIELVDIDLPLEDVELMVANNVFHQGYAISPRWHPLAAVDLGALRTELRLDGVPAAEAVGAGLLVDDLVDLARHAASYVGAFGGTIPAGSLLLMGSLTPIVPVRPGQLVEVAIEPLGAVTLQL